MAVFNNRKKKFDDNNLAYLANFAQIAYKTPDEIMSDVKDLGFSEERSFFISDEKTDTQLCITADERKIVIAFRGTEGDKIKDWGTDANTKWVEDSLLGNVHEGFFKAYESIVETLNMKLQQLQDNNQRIWITGHSLGGALATVCAATLEIKEKKEVAGVYTFGQPRVGNSEFRDKYNEKLLEKSFRFVNNNDVVTRVPPQFFGFHHIGKLYYFDHDEILHKDNSLSWWGKFWDRIEGRYEDLLDLTPDGVSDHSMSNYERMSKNNLNNS